MKHETLEDAGGVADLRAEYDILGEIGRGGSAVVYHARDRDLGRDVAIKVVHPRPTSPDDDPVARLAREARLVAQLQHANIVSVYAVRRLRGGGLALSMQLVDGGTLKTAVQAGGPLPPDRVEAVLRDVAAALAYAHARGLVHRDVKPENIFLDERSGVALLADFGIARSTEADASTMTGTAVGTPFYMSPEQVDGGVVDGRSDLYSLGLVAWEALTGHRPWNGESLYSVIYKQKFEELPPIEALRPGVPRRLQYVVERMLQKRPGARWAGAEGLLAQLNHPVLPADYTRWQRALAGRVAHYREVEAELAAERAAASTVEPLTSASTMQFAPGSRPTGSRALPAAAVAPLSSRDAARPWVPGLVGVTSLGVTAHAPAPLVDDLPQPGTTVDLRATPPVSALTNEQGTTPTPQYGDAVEPSWEPATSWRRMRAQPRLRRALVASAVLAALTSAGMLAYDNLPFRLTGVAGPSSIARSGLLGTPSNRPNPDEPYSTRGEEVNAERMRVADVGDRSTAGLVAAGGRHSCALTLAGRAHCWGANDRGQLGDGGPAVSHAAPVAVTGLFTFTALTNGRAHSCALTRLGDVYCWGANASGQLGDATTVRRNAPVRVAGPSAYTALTAGGAHSCAVTGDGALQCWGANEVGQLGIGTRDARVVPTTVSITGHVTTVVAGAQHTCAVTDDGRLFCWGANADGQLGTGRVGASVLVPEPVTVQGRVVAVALGAKHTCAATAEGTIWCWGRNDDGQLGVLGRAGRPSPVQVNLGRDRVVSSIAAGASHTCALDASGVVTCWGRNVRGAVGNGSGANRSMPAIVRLPSPAVAVTTGAGHSCATTVANGTLCWGDNLEGQLGDATKISRPIPAPVHYPTGVVARTGATTIAQR